jgi:hypothetical protein
MRSEINEMQTVFTYFLPVLHDLPIFGSHVANTWLWTATLSPGFFGGGMIMGPEITLHMLLGAIVGWAILSPYAKTRGYAPGPTDDWETGSRGWIIWISLSALIADAVVKIGWICLEAVHNNGARYLTAYTHYFRSHAVWHRGLAREDTLAADHEISNDSNTDAPMSIMKRTAPIAAFGLSILLCVATTTIVFSSVVPWYHVLLSVLLALPMAVVSIRTLGESDYNPQSGLCKFALGIISVVYLGHYPLAKYNSISAVFRIHCPTLERQRCSDQHHLCIYLHSWREPNRRPRIRLQDWATCRRYAYCPVIRSGYRVSIWSNSF